MKQLKAVIFDVDGTLAETELHGHRVAFNLAFKEHQLGWHWDIKLYEKLLAVAGGKERMRYFLSKFCTNVKSYYSINNLIYKLYVSKTEYYMKLLENKSMYLRPGIFRLLNEIKDMDMRIVIATTTAFDNATALIKNTLGEHTLKWFDYIAAGDIVSRKKPAPDIFIHCLDELKLDAASCITVEDSSNGVKSSVRAGIKTIVTLNKYARNKNFDGAISVFNHLGEKNKKCKLIHGKEINNSYINVEVLKYLHAYD